MKDQIDIEGIINVNGQSSSETLLNRDGTPNTQEPILQPYEYLSNLPSNNNNIRRNFIKEFQKLFFDDKTAYAVNHVYDIISLLHNSSLLIDDIEDNSKYRRGFPSAHVKYGTALTINCANLMYFKAMRLASHLLSRYYLSPDVNVDLQQREQDVCDAFEMEMINLHQGQGFDIYWRDYLPELKVLPTIEEYLRMVQNKTGGLFRLSVKLLDAFTAKPLPEAELNKVLAIANLAGIIYQIRDDYLNLVDARYSTMKGIAGEDLIEGKLSLPILMNLRKELHAENSPVHKLLYEFRTSKLRSKQPELLQQAVKYLHDENTMQETHDMLMSCKEKFHTLLEEFGYGSSDLYKLIERLCDL
ncbi:BTS1 [Candida theae]|uniref:BTS1 n=1 Tax=Candida theae TaxID=1198502 RepID=A0AAD5FY88_9ASCO|nr:BTS1 [Candida theae]KAI5957727.1 BTS1 [Candida theae]